MTCRKILPLLCLLGIVAGASLSVVAADTIVFKDSFDDGKLAPTWDAANYPQNDLGKLDTITFGDPPVPGELVVNSVDVFESHNQVTFIMRDDHVLDEVGEFVQVDVRVLDEKPLLNTQVGLGLATTAHGLLRDRSNTLMFVLRGDGGIHATAYGSGGTELNTPGIDPPALLPSPVVATLRVVRSSPNHYQLWHGKGGQADTYLGTADFQWQDIPQFPALMIGNGLTSFTVAFDNFIVGRTVVEPKPTPTPRPSPIPLTEQVTLPLPKNIMDLPKAPSQRHMVHAPPSAEAMTYHHGATAEVWKGRLYVAWHATQKGEDSPPYKAMVTSAPLNDLNAWSEPVAVSHLDTTAYERYMRKRYELGADKQVIVNNPTRLLHATPERLYLWCLGWVVTENKHFGTEHYGAGRVLWTDDGATWHEVAPEELDTLQNERGLGSIRNSGSNHNFARLRDGRLMAFGLREGLWCPTTTDTTGLTSWTGATIDSRDCDDVGEPGGWEGPDGVLHGTARNGTRIWHAFSRDGGQTWSKLAQQPNFPDCPGNKDFGSLPDGRVWYVGNPVTGSRDQLVLALSDDGWKFNQSWLVRWEPAEQRYPGAIKGIGNFQYPDAAYADGMLYIVYSIQREAIELTAVPLDSLPKREQADD